MAAKRSKTGSMKKRSGKLTSKPNPVAPTASTKKATAPKEDHRWPEGCTDPGEFFLLPKVLVQRLGDFKDADGNRLKPEHLWLILALQSDRMPDRVPRYYWAQLAAWAGVSKDTVRRWAYALQEMGFLRIEQIRRLDSHQQPRPGLRNERNRFHLQLFEKVCAERQKLFRQEKDAQRRKFPKGGNK